MRARRLVSIHFALVGVRLQLRRRNEVDSARALFDDGDSAQAFSGIELDDFRQPAGEGLLEVIDDLDGLPHELLAPLQHADQQPNTVGVVLRLRHLHRRLRPCIRGTSCRQVGGSLKEHLDAAVVLSRARAHERRPVYVAARGEEGTGPGVGLGGLVVEVRIHFLAEH